ncbi:hypothetical protein ROHU_002926 [Labeo rohita]|uniref:Uncharacterized protein n=1 Tax=Labeo rohita TaxID=84645 RepID=A0A498NYR2_LABRO|nr:hypothetical protein ROHU_002926 [Labeo rohita]
MTRNERTVLSGQTAAVRLRLRSASCGGCSSVFSPAVAALRSARARSSLRRSAAVSRVTRRFPPALIVRSAVNAAGARAAGLSYRRCASDHSRSSSRYSRTIVFIVTVEK